MVFNFIEMDAMILAKVTPEGKKAIFVVCDNERELIDWAKLKYGLDCRVQFRSITK
jgi:hypothetical protein